MSVTSTNFLFYADYFALAVEAGLERARALFPAIATSTLVDRTTITNKTNSDVSVANMTRALDTSYEYLWLDAQHTDPIRDAFDGLSTYLLKSSGLSVESYLTQEGIQVDSLYATLANIFGEEITTANIR